MRGRAGSASTHNYGSAKSRPAHRVSWELHRGPIPPGLFVLHKCDTPPCVNPDHLFLGTQQDNLADMRAKGRSRRGEVPQGEEHPDAKLTAEDVRIIKFAYACGGAFQATIGEVFGVSQAVISAVVRRQIWKSVGGGNPRSGAWRTHCPQGHAYDEANTRRGKNDKRACRACDRDRHAKLSTVA